MIDKIEFSQLPDGVAITFYYDTDCMDTFSMFEKAHINQVMELCATCPEPEHVLIAIRDFGRFSLH